MTQKNDTLAANKSMSTAGTNEDIQQILQSIYDSHKDNQDGALADYIPELTKVNPNDFGIAIATVDGQIYTAGDADTPFTIQSCSKPLTYGLAQELCGIRKVEKHVGTEPTGRLFNALVIEEENNRPHNPMVNAGAISMTSLIHDNYGEIAFHKILDMYSALAGRELTYDQEVYLSEKKTGHMNRAIAYLMHDKGIINEDVEGKLNAYFRQCAIQVTAVDLANIAASLANVGDNPITGVSVLSPLSVRHVLSVMFTCGMYNYSGQWAVDVGIPAKSGVGGGIMAVVNRQIGIGIYSPLLDPRGNSVRGIAACIDLVEGLGLHAFEFTNAGSRLLETYLKS